MKQQAHWTDLPVKAINYHSHTGQTALMLAAAYGHRRLLVDLLVAEASPNLQDHDGNRINAIIFITVIICSGIITDISFITIISKTVWHKPSLSTTPYEFY